MFAKEKKGNSKICLKKMKLTFINKSFSNVLLSFSSGYLNRLKRIGNNLKIEFLFSVLIATKMLASNKHLYLCNKIIRMLKVKNKKSFLINNSR